MLISLFTFFISTTSIPDIAFSSEKVYLSESGEKYAQIKHCSQAKTVQCSSKQIWEQQRMDLYTGGGTIIIDYRLGQDYMGNIVMFLSAVWTLILTAPIHCRGSIVEQVMLCNISLNLVWQRNKLIYILDGLRESFQHIFMFGWTHLIINKKDLIGKFYDYSFGKTEFSYLFATRSINIHGHYA